MENHPCLVSWRVFPNRGDGLCVGTLQRGAQPFSQWGCKRGVCFKTVVRRVRVFAWWGGAERVLAAGQDRVHVPVTRK